MASSEPAAMANPRSRSGMGGSPVESGKNRSSASKIYKLKINDENKCKE